MKALVKKEQNDLADSKHTPKLQPKQTKPEIEALVLKWREQTKRGEKRLRKILLDEEKITLPISTIGKILKRSNRLWWQSLGMNRKVIRKDHPEDDSFVERSHLTDDEEFYLPFLSQINSEQELLQRGLWWQDYYNRLRGHQSLNDLSPYQYL